jgi:serine/threonine protein kinase
MSPVKVFGVISKPPLHRGRNGLETQRRLLASYSQNRAKRQHTRRSSLSFFGNLAVVHLHTSPHSFFEAALFREMPSSPMNVPSAQSLQAPSGADIPSAPTPTVAGSLTADPGVLGPKKDGVVPTREVGKLALFHFDEVIRGPFLGHGSFSDVYEVQQFKPLTENDENVSEAHLLDARRYYTEQTAEAATDKSKKYAIKCLKDHFDDPKMFQHAAKDMETEVNILANIDHPYIIKVYAKSASGTKASSCTKEHAHDFFIVVDRLSGTLADKIAHWKREKESIVGRPFFSFFDHSHVVKKKEFIMERVRIASDVASALAYLHAERIVYRDLKADNIGFDFKGKCKLFDFGLARRLPSDPKKQRGDTFVMSGKTGSLFFMAPEVFNGQPYNQKADVYSFAMLLWNMLALELPYLEFIYDRSVFDNKVMNEGKRPHIQGTWPKEIQSLLLKAWSKDMDERPTMEEVCIMTKSVIVTRLVSPRGRSTKRSSFM